MTRLYATRDAPADGSLFLGILTPLTEHSEGGSEDDTLKVSKLARMAGYNISLERDRSSDVLLNGRRNQGPTRGN